MAKKSDPVYATAKNPLISAVTNGLYSFLNEEDAIKVLEQLKEKFTTSSVLKIQGSSNPAHAIFWVRELDISKQQKDEGFKGNYIVIY